MTQSTCEALTDTDRAGKNEQKNEKKFKFTETSSANQAKSFMTMTRRFRSISAPDAQLLAFFRLLAITLLLPLLFSALPVFSDAHWPRSNPLTLSADQVLAFFRTSGGRPRLGLFHKLVADAAVILGLQEAPLDAVHFVPAWKSKKLRQDATRQLSLERNSPNVLDVGVRDARRLDELARHAREVADRNPPPPAVLLLLLPPIHLLQRRFRLILPVTRSAMVGA